MENETLEDLFSSTNDIISDVDDRTLSSEKYAYSLKLRLDDIEDEKKLHKFIRSCESLIRHSPEYKLWTSYIREVLGESSCTVTGELHQQTHVDIHHHPFSLYAITKAIINKLIINKDGFCSFDIATKVIELHYENRVGYIPLVSSIHEKYHNGFIQLPMELVKGDWRFMYDNYIQYLDDEDVGTINSRLSISKNNCGWNKDKTWNRDNYKKGVETLSK